MAERGAKGQRPVCVIIGEPGPDKYLPVAACNDTLLPADVSYRVWDADTGETVAEGAYTVPANQNSQVARLRTYAGDRRLYLIAWETDGESCGNHYLAGMPPLSLARYRLWLEAIAALPRALEAAVVAR